MVHSLFSHFPTLGILHKFLKGIEQGPISLLIDFPIDFGEHLGNLKICNSLIDELL
jgi:hypothetical protein